MGDEIPRPDPEEPEEPREFKISFDRPPSAERLRRLAKAASEAAGTGDAAAPNEPTATPPTSAGPPAAALPPVDPADLQAVLVAMVAAAKAGNVEAARLVLDYALRSQG